MTYIINKTDGTVLTEIIDGTLDQSSTDLTLIGKSSNSYGEYINENFLHLLENFANSTQPNKSIVGQLWFDNLENRLKVYDGKGYKVAGSTIVAPTLPSSIAQGDIWISSKFGQLWFNNGVETILAGPQTHSITGFNVVTVYGDDQNSYTIIKIMIDEIVVGILSNSAFTLDSNINDILGFSSINQGLNLASDYLITNIKRSLEPSHAVNNERLTDAIRQRAPYSISLDISVLYQPDNPYANEAERNTAIGSILDNIFLPVDFQVLDLDVLPTCKVVCTNTHNLTSPLAVRTFQLKAGTTNDESEVKWRVTSDPVDLSYN